MSRKVPIMLVILAAFGVPAGLTAQEVASALSGFTGQPKASAETYSMSLAGAVR
jgi:hypothetical protein